MHSKEEKREIKSQSLTLSRSEIKIYTLHFPPPLLSDCCRVFKMHVLAKIIRKFKKTQPL